jgi:hypothetical protein
LIPGHCKIGFTDFLVSFETCRQLAGYQARTATLSENPSMSDLISSLTGYMSAVAIPIVAIVGGISFAAYSTYLKVRRQRETLQMYHAERMAAIEKGIELPPLPPEVLHDRYYDASDRGGYRRRRRSSGVTVLFVGVAVTVALWEVNQDSTFWWGLIIVAWGLGKLVSSQLDGASGAPPQAGDGGPVPPGSTRIR